MKILNVETLGTGESFEVEICKGTTPLDILECLGMERYQLGKKVEGEGFRPFGKEEDICEKVDDQDELVLLPEPDIDPPFNPEKDIKIVEAENGKVHEVSVKQGDKTEKILDKLDFGEGVFYKESDIQVTLSRVTDLFNDVKEGERLIIFSPSALPNFLSCLRGGDQEL